MLLVQCYCNAIAAALVAGAGADDNCYVPEHHMSSLADTHATRLTPIPPAHTYNTAGKTKRDWGLGHPLRLLALSQLL